MLYTDFLQTCTHCPFCDTTRQEEVTENDRAFLTYALAPYHEHHLLVVPKRHIVLLLDIDDNERADIDALIRLGARVLERLGHTDYSVLVRNGDGSGRSVDHLHYHIVPGVHLGREDSRGLERAVMSVEEVARTVATCKDALAQVS